MSKRIKHTADSLDLTYYAQRQQGWHTPTGDKHTMKAVARAVLLGSIETNELGQFRAVKRASLLTPGPWSLETAKDNEPGLFSVWSGEELPRRLIATVYDGNVPLHEDQANAALIASAPDMAIELATLRRERDELREALRAIAELETDCENQQFRLTRFQSAQIARRALLTHKGEQNT